VYTAAPTASRHAIWCRACSALLQCKHVPVFFSVFGRSPVLFCAIFTVFFCVSHRSQSLCHTGLSTCPVSLSPLCCKTGTAPCIDVRTSSTSCEAPMHMALGRISMLSPCLGVTGQDLMLTRHEFEHITRQSNTLFWMDYRTAFSLAQKCMVSLGFH